jgi:hypothetical protein
MGTLSESIGRGGGPLFTGAELAAARAEVPESLGVLPFLPGAASRSLWVVFLGETGVWTHAVLPVDDRLDKPDPDHIAHVCTMVGIGLTYPLSYANEEALVVLRRPAPAAISEADAYIFRLVCEAATDRQTAPWRFYVTGPDGARECFRQATGRRAAAQSAVLPRQ